MKKFLIGFLLSFIIFLVPRSVLAADVTFSFPDSWVYSSDSSLTSDYNTIFNNLKQNNNFTSISESGIACIHPRYVGSDYYIFVFVDLTSQYSMDFYPSSYDTGFCFFCSKIYTAHFSKENLNSALTCTFSVTNNPSSVSTFQDCLCYNVTSSYFCSSTSRFNGSSINNSGLGNPFGALFHYDLSFSPDYSLNGVIVGFDFSVDAFVQWLIDTGKYQDLPAYIGTAKLKSFVQFYYDWGSNNNLFVVKILEWMVHFNIGAQSLENRNILKSSIDRLYQEYCNQAFVSVKHNSSLLPHHRHNIETVTTDDDLTLVTDDSNDDIYTSLLRDILRGVISIPGQIYNCTEMIISKLDYLNWNVTVSNDGGSSCTDLTPVINKLDDVIEALQTDTVSVEIDQTTQDDTDQFFDDWNLEFSSALNNKFPVAGQLSTLFTDFWEKCGVDVGGDGETFEYYNPGVLTASVSRSRSAGVSESDIVSDFLGKFDNADPSFLDDASFNVVPDLSVTVGGQSVSILDFRVYAKYREKIHFIISFVIWTLYLLHLYKALPTIIGQVADVASKTSEL